MTEPDTMRRALALLGELMACAHVDESHGVQHARNVMVHCIAAEADPDCTWPRLAVRLAALLHDADDRKYFPGSSDYANARRIVRDVAPELEEDVVRMISLVSCASNGNAVPPDTPSWMLLPRDADRLEALGHVGIARCYEFTVSRKRPLFTADTPRARTDEELDAVATPQRFAAYQATGGSASMIDHYYDKLLHVGAMASGSAYMIGTAACRVRRMREFVLDFGVRGAVDECELKRMCATHLGGL